MSTRWFFSWARVGATAGVVGSALPTSVAFTRVTGDGAVAVSADGPPLSPAGPAHVLGFDPALVVREDPPSGTPAPENVMASVELAHADLPWLLSQESVTPPAAPGRPPSDPVPLPWMVLVVLRDDEAGPPRSALPLPVLSAPVEALPPLRERWAWAHVEARLDDSVQDLGTAAVQAQAGVRSRSAAVVGRLLCPRRLDAGRSYVAAVVPATAGGRAVGLGQDVPADPGADAWPTGTPVVDLPVYHWWTFSTGDAGTFEDLARRLRYRPPDQLALGARTVDVSRPWPGEDDDVPAGSVTTTLDGALRVPRSAGPEIWSDAGARDRFRALLGERLDAPASRRAAPDGNELPADGGVPDVGPPLYGGHHTGRQTVPSSGDSWLSTLNLEVRRRVAAALGARYVQLEQEFLMARAWEQAGAIREANRLLAVAELAAVTAERALDKHVLPLPVGDLVTTLAPVGTRLAVSSAPPSLAPQGPLPLAAALAASAVPTGVVTTAFARLTRPTGALTRRAGRGPGGGGRDDQPSVIEAGLRESQMLVGADDQEAGLPAELRGALAPLPLQVLRMTDRIPFVAATAGASDGRRPLGPIMAHPTFSVPIGEELLTRWPEWALPGIGGVPQDSVTLLETNPGFVAALLVGLNHAFNQELLWREFPTDQRGTPFARFWPTEGPDIAEIATWPTDAALDAQVQAGDAGTLAMLARGELLRRFPGTALLAVRGQNGRLPEQFEGIPATPLALDDTTVLYLFSGITDQRAVAEDWFFVFREPVRGTTFGLDTGAPDGLRSWADLRWSQVSLRGGYVLVGEPPPAPVPEPGTPPPPDPAVWGRDPADMARIVYQQPFQLAFRASALLNP